MTNFIFLLKICAKEFYFDFLRMNNNFSRKMFNFIVRIWIDRKFSI